MLFENVMLQTRLFGAFVGTIIAGKLNAKMHSLNMKFQTKLFCGSVVAEMAIKFYANMLISNMIS